MWLSLFWSAYTLKCYNRLPGASGRDAVKACPSSRHLCGAMRIVSYGGTDHFVAVCFWSKETNSLGLTELVVFVSGRSKLDDTRIKSCFLPHECVEGSVNFGISRIAIPIKCCDSDLCNTHDAPGNTYMCYFFHFSYPLCWAFCKLVNFHIKCLIQLPWLIIKGGTRMYNISSTEPSKSVPNGKKCYHCSGPKCTVTLNCEGKEDYCFSNSGGAELSDCCRYSWTNC